MAHLSCVGEPVERLREILDEMRRGRHRQRARAARRPAAGARPMDAASRTGSSRSVELIELIREALRLLHRRDLLPRGASGGARPRARPALPEAQGRRRRELPDHAALLRQRGLLPLRRARARVRHRRADHRGHHADHELRADQALHEHVRRDDPGRPARAARGAATPRARRRSPSWASPTRRCSAPTCSRAARPGSTSTRSTSRRRRARSCPRSRRAAVGARRPPALRLCSSVDLTRSDPPGALEVGEEAEHDRQRPAHHRAVELAEHLGTSS